MEKRKVNINELKKMYIDNKLSVRRCARHFNVSAPTITSRLIKNNITIRCFKYVNMDLLKTIYYKEKKSLKECAQIMKLDKLTITKRLKNNTRKLGGVKGYEHTNESKNNMSKAQQKNKKQKTTEDDKKKCNKCGLYLPIEQFSIRIRNGRKMLQYHCKKCQAQNRKEYRLKNIESQRNKAREYNKKHREKISLRTKQRLYEMKMAAFNAYGGAKCSCCGVTDLVFLTIDHINGGGSKHRKRIKTSIYQWLKDNNYPPGYRILCWNCNWAEAHGGCPHVL